MKHDATCLRATGWGTCDCGAEAVAEAAQVLDQIRTAAVRDRQADALTRALSVRRKDWKVGKEAWGPFYAQDRQVLWTIVDVDWNRGAGPLICQWFDEDAGCTHQSFFQPWDLTPDDDVPRTLDEVRAFLNG